MACMLWEDTFYVDGKKSTEIIEETCSKVEGSKIVELALEVHEKGLLRHIPLYLIVQALKKKAKCKESISKICSRPDQMTELLSLYWKDGKKSLSAQLKKGLANAFTKFDEYQIAKYNRDGPIKLIDVLFLCHAKPKNNEQAEMWKRLISKTLKTPDTWEVKLSSGADKKESFQDLLESNKMGKLAIIRNLRNMQESGVSKELIKSRLLENTRPLLPFQYLAAAREVPTWEDVLDDSMIQSARSKTILQGNTCVLIDVSGSMDYNLSDKGTMKRMDAAAGLAIILREVCDAVEFITFSDRCVRIPTRRGMALRDAIVNSQPHSSTYLGNALRLLYQHGKGLFDRIIVITDEQAQDVPPKMEIEKCYIINVGTYENGIKNNGEWLTISGFSEATIDYILEIETPCKTLFECYNKTNINRSMP
jgi:hypothetical protein